MRVARAGQAQPVPACRRTARRWLPFIADGLQVPRFRRQPELRPRNDDRILLATPLPGVPAERDLTVRAARLLQQAAGVRQGVDIRLAKRLPLGGGLGGGSSDAATVLLALNRLWGTKLSSAQLQRIGLELGADVPIFIHGHAAFAEGVGERFVDVALPPAWYLVLAPPVTVPTAEIFGAPDLRRDTPAMDPADWRPGMGGNDLEPVACRLYPEVARHLAWLRQFGPRDERFRRLRVYAFATRMPRAHTPDCRRGCRVSWRTGSIESGSGCLSVKLS